MTGRNQYDLISEIISRQDDQFGEWFGGLQKTLEEFTMALKDVKTKLEQTNAVIAEISGDIAELKTSNDQLVAKVEELKQQIPDNQLIADIEKLAADQATALSNIASVVPEPSPVAPDEPEEPTDDEDSDDEPAPVEPPV